MIEQCTHCGAPIPDGACQQGQKINDTWYPLHVGCADTWANTLIPVWNVDWDGGDLDHCEADLSTIQAYISELEPDECESITITARAPMKRIDYLRLPEL